MVVLDASVILKWLLDDPVREPYTDKATALIRSVLHGSQDIIQPIHWLPEVAAVLARLTPGTAANAVDLLTTLELPINNEPSVMGRATTLATETGQHLFDTLYHAVALETADAILITADDRYYRKTLGVGRIVALRDWTQ